MNILTVETTILHTRYKGGKRRHSVYSEANTLGLAPRIRMGQIGPCIDGDGEIFLLGASKKEGSVDGRIVPVRLDLFCSRFLLGSSIAALLVYSVVDLRSCLGRVYMEEQGAVTYLPIRYTGEAGSSCAARVYRNEGCLNCRALVTLPVLSKSIAPVVS